MPEKSNQRDSFKARGAEQLITEAAAIDILTTLEGRAAQSFNNLQKALTNVLTQYAEQSAVIFELARGELGGELSEGVKAYKAAMDKKLVELEAMQAAIQKTEDLQAAAVQHQNV